MANGKVLTPISAAERRLDVMFAVARPGAVTEEDAEPLNVLDPAPQDSHRVRAEFLLQRLSEAADAIRTPVFRKRSHRPSVIRLEDSYIVGVLDLRGDDLPCVLEFDRCRFQQAPDVRQSNIGGLEFAGCWLPGLRAKNLRSGNDLVINRCTMDGTTSTSPGLDAIDLTDADINGSIRLEYSTFTHPRGRALIADRCTSRGGVSANGLTVTGELRLAGMRIGGYLNLNGARLDNPGRDALVATGITVGGPILCSVATWGEAKGQPFRAAGRLYLPSAKIESDLCLSSAQLDVVEPLITSLGTSNLTDPHAALVADRIQVVGNVELDQGFTCSGTIRMDGARIGGTLRMAGSTVWASGRQGRAEEDTEQAGDESPAPAWVTLDPAEAVRLDSAQVRGDLDAVELTVHGQLRMLNTAIMGSLVLTEAVFRHPDDDAIWAPRLTVGGEMDCRNLRAEGGLLLAGASIGVSLNLRHAVLEKPGHHPHSGYPKPALDLRAARVGRDVVCSGRFTAHGGVRLHSTNVGRHVQLVGAALTAPEDATALNLYGLSCRELGLALREPPDGAVVLSYAKCATLNDNEHLWAGENTVDLVDFSFDALHTDAVSKARTRLGWISHATEYYSPGPYDQLAATLTAAGEDEEATAVLMEKQRLRYAGWARDSRWFGWAIWLGSQLQRFTVGYGYRPMRALVWLVVCAVLGSLWFSGHVLVPVNEQDHPAWNPVLYSLDLLVPIVDLGQDNRWRADGASQWISSGLIAIGWILATTVAAGLTRMLKRLP
ncbi:oxidoreductase [Pseudonocardiaceae bacterium YIM PH 21723]|nr:oxidoreductase [Pseudonocardiaceae bacterium YIM PH 21723]